MYKYASSCLPMSTQKFRLSCWRAETSRVGLTPPGPKPIRDESRLFTTETRRHEEKVGNLPVSRNRVFKVTIQAISVNSSGSLICVYLRGSVAKVFSVRPCLRGELGEPKARESWQAPGTWA